VSLKQFWHLYQQVQQIERTINPAKTVHTKHWCIYRYRRAYATSHITSDLWQEIITSGIYACQLADDSPEFEIEILSGYHNNSSDCHDCNRLMQIWKVVA
jgi:hypothetical protein